MQNFQYYNPTRLIFGQGSIEKIRDVIPLNSKILMLYGGGSIFKNGVYDQVKASLPDRMFVEFKGIEANPRYETLMNALDVLRSDDFDFILAVGGGSVIDGAKFISAAYYFDGDPVEILKKRIPIRNKAFPYVTVLTLPATGSEMNSGSVVTIEATQEKLPFGGPALFPVFSICDPTVIISLPQRQLQNGVIDAFMHVMEQYLTYPTGALLQDRLAESVLQTLVEIGPNVVENPSDYSLASNFMWACTMAHNGLLNRGVPTDWATHMIGHELTARFGIDHARTLAIIAPKLYRVMFNEKKLKLAQYGRRIWGILDKTDEETAQLAIEETEQFFRDMGMQLQISDYTSDDPKLTDHIIRRFEQRQWNELGENGSVTPEKVRAILEAAL